MVVPVGLWKVVSAKKNVALISGDRSDYHLLEKINARDDKYEICKVVNYRRGLIN